MIQEIDWSVGQVLQTLKDLDIADNTVVVFSSDNGPWLSFKTHGGSAGPLRAGKGTTFEGGQRVPTIFWGPGIVKPDMVTDLGSTLDLIHTFASLSGTSIPEDRKMDSYDLSPVLKGAGQSPRKEFFYWTRGKLHAARMGNWKLHIHQRQPVNYGKEVILDSPELYNLEADISETYDLSAQHPDIVVELEKMIKQHQEDTSERLPDNLVGRLD